jgi:predicted DNA-binding protein
MSSIQNNKEKENIEELVDSEGGTISGDRNVVSSREIETGPVPKPWNDDSDYVKGVSTTTDRATRYRQDIPWFAVYSYSDSSGSRFKINEKVKTKKELEAEIKEDLVKRSKKDGDVWEKDYNSKVEKIVDTIEDGDLNDNQLERIKKAVLDKISKKDA